MNSVSIASDVPLTPSDDRTSRLAILFDTHHPRLYRLARRLTTGPEDALDLVQETFVRAARSPASIPVGASREEAWLVRTLINLRRDQWRKADVRRRHDSERRPAVEPGTAQEGALLARVVVWRALDALTPRRRAVVVMHELEGLPVSAIASTLGIASVTVRWHPAMGRRDLARILEPESGGTDESHE